MTSRVRVGRQVSPRSSRLSFSQCGFLTSVRNIKTKVGARDSKSRCQRLVPIPHPFPQTLQRSKSETGTVVGKRTLRSSQRLYFKITEYRRAHCRLLLAVSNGSAAPSILRGSVFWTALSQSSVCTGQHHSNVTAALGT